MLARQNGSGSPWLSTTTMRGNDRMAATGMALELYDGEDWQDSPLVEDLARARGVVV